VVGDRTLPSRELDTRPERPRPGDLELEWAAPPVVGLGELVEVLPEEAEGPPFVRAGAVGEAPPVRLRLDVQALEDGCTATEHVGARPPGGKLGQVRDAVTEEVTDGHDGLARALPRPRADPGGEGHAPTPPGRGDAERVPGPGSPRPARWVARPARRMVPEPTTRVPS